RLKLELPGLPHQIDPEAVVRFFVDEPIAGPLVDASRRFEHAVGPEDDLVIPGLARELGAFVHQSRSDPESARRGLDQQQPQLGDSLRLLDQKYGAEDFAISLRYPAAFSFGVMVLEKLGHDFRDQRFELFVPAVLLGIQRAMPVDDPSHVAGPMEAQHVRTVALRLPAPKTSDGFQSLDQALPLGG